MLESGIFHVWVAPLEGTVSGRDVKIFAPNSFMAGWLKRQLLEDIRKAASLALDVQGQDICLHIEVGASRRPRCSAQSSAEIVGKVLEQTGRQGELPIKLAPFKPVCQWRYKFDDFVTGPTNSIAAAAAREMCQNDQLKALYITSAPGLGKTHLAQAAGEAISSAGAPIKVAYLTAEQFASRYVAALRAKNLEDFKQYLCGLDMLLLEDVHFLQKKSAMQELALSVIKNLESRGSRVIFTSSFTPRQLQDMDSQLVSHFCSGILANMERPNADMRQEILRRKAKSYQVALPEDVCAFLSERLSSDVRQLESCLKSMVFKARLLNSGLTLDLAMDTIGQYAAASGVMDVEGIIRLVCESFGLTKMELCSKSRRKEYVHGRNTVFYLARKHTDMSLEEIGCIFNRRHSTVMRGITQLERELAAESSIGRQIARAVSLIERKCGFAEAHN